MGVRQLYIDGQLAEDAEEIADILGYPDLEHYVMDLLIKEIEEKQDMVAIAHRVVDVREGDDEDD